MKEKENQHDSQKTAMWFNVEGQAPEKREDQCVMRVPRFVVVRREVENKRKERK